MSHQPPCIPELCLCISRPTNSLCNWRRRGRGSSGIEERTNPVSILGPRGCCCPCTPGGRGTQYVLAIGVHGRNPPFGLGPFARRGFLPPLPGAPVVTGPGLGAASQARAFLLPGPPAGHDVFPAHVEVGSESQPIAGRGGPSQLGEREKPAGALSPRCYCTVAQRSQSLAAHASEGTGPFVCFWSSMTSRLVEGQVSR